MKTALRITEDKARSDHIEQLQRLPEGQDSAFSKLTFAYAIDMPATKSELAAYETAVENLARDPHSSVLSFCLNYRYALDLMSGKIKGPSKQPLEEHADFAAVT